MIKFSLILNSRNRPTHLNSLLESIVKTTNDLDSIEVIVGLDTDDPTLQTSLEVLRSYPFPSYWVGGRPPNLIGALNALAPLSRGCYLFILNDDVNFLTSGWDSLAWAALTTHSVKFPDGVVYGRTRDLSVDKDKDGKYAAFPIISKKATEILNFTIATEFTGLGGDVATYRIYEKIDRVVDLSNIILQHTLHQTIEQIMNPDLTAYEMRQLTHEHRMDWKTYDINPYVWKLQHYINSFSQDRLANYLKEFQQESQKERK